jgi:hypothetical protein
MAKAKSVNRGKGKAASAVVETSGSGLSSLPLEERQRMIAEAAYFRAQARGFQGGDPVDDWLTAEAEINRSAPLGKRQ